MLYKSFCFKLLTDVNESGANSCQNEGCTTTGGRFVCNCEELDMIKVTNIATTFRSQCQAMATQRD